MEICRAFDIFEIVICILILIIYIPLLIYFLWRIPSIIKYGKENGKFTKKAFFSNVLIISIGTAIGLIIVGAYLYIKSMFC